MSEPWLTKRELAAELKVSPRTIERLRVRRYRDRLEARRTEETCASFAERWLEEWKRPETSTQRLYAAAARRFADHFGPTPLGEVERLSARTWALSVPRSVSRVIGTMYEDARNIGLVESNPFSNLRLAATERQGEINPPSLEEYRALREACSVLGGYGREMRAMIDFAAWTGVRQGELCALQWEDITESEVTVRRSRKLDGTLGLPKNGKSRTVTLLPPARVLEEVPRRPDAFVFHSPRGKPLIKGTHGMELAEGQGAGGRRGPMARPPPLLRHAAPGARARPLRGLDSSGTRTAARSSWPGTGTPRSTPRRRGY